MTMTSNEKKVELISMYARINAAQEIQKEFDQLFKVLDMVPSELNATIEKRDVINIIDTYKNMTIFKGTRAGICNKKGEAV